MNNPLLPPASLSPQQCIQHLQELQKRCLEVISQLEPRARLTVEELRTLDAVHHMRRARQVLLWHLQGDTASLRKYSDWPTFLIDLYRKQQSVH